jgi:hypothetical protein
MNWGSCFSASNNLYSNQPALMEDGRNYTAWRPASEISQSFQTKLKLPTNWEYRQYMMNNALDIMKSNQLEQCLENPQSLMMASNQMQQSQPTLLDKTQFTSDLKQLYVDKFVLQSRMRTPVFTQDQLIDAGILRHQ